MNTKQENILNMYDGFVKYVNEQSETAKLIPFFMEAYGQFLTAYEGIQHYRKIQDSDVPIATLDKSQLRKQVESATLGLSAQLVALAQVKKNYSLSKRASYTSSELATLADSAMKDVAELMTRLAQEFLTELKIYEVTTNQLTSFKELIALFGTSLTKTRQSMSDKVNATEQIEQLFDVAKEKMDLMDKLIEASKGKYANFYNGFVRVTHVTEVNGRSLTLRAQAKDLMGNPIPNVSFEILANAGVKTPRNGEQSPLMVSYLHKKTTETGNFQVQHLPEGTYTALVRKLGFQDKEVTFRVVGGEMVDLEVTMEPA